MFTHLNPARGPIQTIVESVFRGCIYGRNARATFIPPNRFVLNWSSDSSGLQTPQIRHVPVHDHKRGIVRVLFQGPKGHNVNFAVDSYRLLGDLLELAEGSHDVELEDLSPAFLEFRQLGEGSSTRGRYDLVAAFSDSKCQFFSKARAR